MDIRDAGALPSEKESELEEFFERDITEQQEQKKISFDLENKTENKVFLDIMLGNLIKQLSLKEQISTEFESQIINQFGPGSMRQYITLPYVEIYSLFYPAYLLYKRKMNVTKVAVWYSGLLLMNQFHRQYMMQNYKLEKYSEYLQHNTDFHEMMGIYKSSIAPKEVLFTMFGMANQSPLLLAKNLEEERRRYFESLDRSARQFSDQLILDQF